MQMTTRVRRAWQSLAGQVANSRPGQPAFVYALRGWLRHDAPLVSTHAAEALRGARGVALVLEGDPDHLPISDRAAAAFVAALSADVAADPVAFIQHVDELCWDLALFAREDDSCPRCQGDLMLWTDATGAAFEQCTTLGCCFDAQGVLVREPPETLRPATRAEVLARYPGATLVTGR